MQDPLNGTLKGVCRKPFPRTTSFKPGPDNLSTGKWNDLMSYRARDVEDQEIVRVATLAAPAANTAVSAHRRAASPLSLMMMYNGRADKDEDLEVVKEALETDRWIGDLTQGGMFVTLWIEAVRHQSDRPAIKALRCP